MPDNNTKNEAKVLNDYRSRFLVFIKKLRGIGRRAAFFDTILFFSVILIGLVIILLSANYMRQVSFKISEQRQLASKNLSRVDSFSSLQTQYNDLKNVMPKVDALLPNDDGVASFLARLDNLSDVTGASATVKIGQKELAIGGTNVFSLPVNISFNGNLAAANRYISELEKLPYLIRIDGVSVTSGEDVNKSSQIQISARLFIKSSQ